MTFNLRSELSFLLHPHLDHLPLRRREQATLFVFLLSEPQQTRPPAIQHDVVRTSMSKQSKVTGYSSSQHATPLLELTCHMGSQSVTYHPAEVTFQPLPQPKLVLDLATPEGRKAELT